MVVAVSSAGREILHALAVGGAVWRSPGNNSAWVDDGQGPGSRKVHLWTLEALEEQGLIEPEGSGPETRSWRLTGKGRAVTVEGS